MNEPGTPPPPGTFDLPADRRRRHAMSWWTRCCKRDRFEGELDRELRDHVERQVADHVRAGFRAPT